MKFDELRARAGEVLSYDENTGLFTWKVSLGRSPAGSLAGHIGKVHGYLIIGFDRKHYYAQRLAWIMARGDPTGYQIDHIDGDRSNNRIDNLRLADMSGNQRNLSVSGRRKGLLIGAYRGRSDSSWSSRIKVDGSSIYLGSFPSEIAAHSAYIEARIKHFGEFADLQGKKIN